MAITTLDNMSCDTSSKCSDSGHSSKYSCRLLKLNFAPDRSVSSATSKCSKSKRNNTRSPYLSGDRVQLLSRVIEKRFVYNPNFVSSFPLAANLYKTNSDDFKTAKKPARKVKKSVLTLPNDPVPTPQACTVSDMNESEYYDKNEEDRKRKVVKKRAPIKNNKKARVREKDIEFYDRDAQYCSQLNINLDCSSTDMMKNFNGDEKRVSNKKKIIPASNKSQTPSNNLSDVWAVLRNINRLQFRPSPPASEESVVQVKKKTQKRLKRPIPRDPRLIETCRTQEFAYIKSYEVDDKSKGSFSQSSSFDRITVIDNQDDFSKMCEEFEKRLLGKHDFVKDSNNTKHPIQINKIRCKSSKSNIRALSNTVSRDNKQLLPSKKKKKVLLKSPVAEQSKSEMTDISCGNRNSLIGTDTLQPNDSSDTFPHKMENYSMCTVKDSFVESNDSRSSKAELPKTINEQFIRNDNSADAVLNKEHESNANTPKGLNHQQRKLRLVTTMPSSCLTPKLTQFEIKRRLANMKFPIVVLGKDQVSSSIHVMDYDPPQFNGLDDHIWPFMIEWSLNPPKDTKLHNNTLSRKCQSYLLDSNSASQIKSKSRKANTGVGTYKQGALKDKKQANNDLTTNKNKALFTPTYNAEINDKILQCTKKQKSIVQLKDKMLNFLYKKTSNRDFNNESYKNDESKPLTLNNYSNIAENNFPALTDSPLKPDNILMLNDRPIDEALSMKCVHKNKKSQIGKHPWAKAKWASDFIDSVMKKIRSGVYYTQDRIDFCHSYQIDLKEVSVQVGSLVDSSDSTQTSPSEVDLSYDEINSNQDDPISIPGFDNTLPLLEIRTLNMNQIAVKHGMTNVMVQFDVTVPAKGGQSTTSLNKTLLLTPITTTESQTKVFKCETTIFNAMLPAELCSILPKMMSNIVDLSKYSMESPALCLTKTDSSLSTITEQTRTENGSLSIIPWIQTSPEIENILEGRFSNVDYKKAMSHNFEFKVKYDQCLIKELLPMDDKWMLLNDLLKYKDSTLVAELNNSEYTHSQISLHQSNKQISAVTDIQNHTICTSVEMYAGDNKLVTTAFKPYNVARIVESMMRSYNLQINLNMSSYFDLLKQYDGRNVQINVSTINDSGIQKNISVSVSNLNIDSLYKAFPIIKNCKKYQTETTSISSLKCIDYINAPQEKIKLQTPELTKVTLKKIKRKGYLRLYRNCKSRKVPSEAKCTNTVNTPLNKITTLDDFFQILGSKNIFSSVFDGNAASKIFSSVMEMKNWITEINEKQALLILLLINKKDTPNLVRFRPMILQGIAVNRITRASELDMEIEVIDRENLDKSPKFEGITYLPESVTDYENLLDELYWIAKTTASDYKKPFDESSERLLKSLLHKRKKLNPSYLRVMARYVGLGLVKTPTEC